MTREIILPGSIEQTKREIQTYQTSGINNPVHVMLLSRHLLFLESYCKQRKELTDNYNNAKNSYWRRQWDEALRQLERLMTNHFAIMNDIKDLESYQVRSTALPCRGYTE